MDNGTQARIGWGTKLLMLSVAFVLDALPIILIIMAGVFLIMGLADLRPCFESGMVASAKCGYYFAKAAVVGGAYGLVVAFIGVPIYQILSAITLIFSYLIFGFWFGINGYNMLDLKGKKVMVNVLGFVLELIPIANLLPGITFLVFRHLSLCALEDKKKQLEQKALAASLMPRRMPRQPRGTPVPT